MSFTFLDHTADIAVKLNATDADKLFQSATLALLAVYFGRESDEPTTQLGATTEQSLRLQSEDGTSLLIDYLNELIYRFDANGLLTISLQLTLIELGSPAQLEGHLISTRYDPSKHFVQTEVKAATHHQVEIQRHDGELSATVVFDL